MRINPKDVPLCILQRRIIVDALHAYIRTERARLNRLVRQHSIEECEDGVAGAQDIITKFERLNN